MALFWLRRTGGAVLVLISASVVIFIGVHALPGDTATALAGESRDPETMAAIREKFGVDQPLPEQYFTWAGKMVTGDFGESAATGTSISSILAERIPVTLELAVLSLIIAVGIGIPAGVLAACRPGAAADRAATGFALVGMSIPSFWLGLVLIVIFAIELHVLPASGYVPVFTDPWQNLKHMLMPALVLGLWPAAIVMRQTRSSMLDALSSDYIRTARAKGLPESRVVVVHALRNSLLSVVTLIGLIFGELVAGAVVTEQIFVVPGFGKLMVEALTQRDYAVIQVVVLIAALGYVLASVAVDVCYSVLNPRIRVAPESS